MHNQTEGNPLFVRETLQFVLDAGLVDRRDGALRRVGDRSLAGRMPEGLRDAVGKRLSRLSEATNRVLSVASVIGREFQVDVLGQVLASPEEDLEPALEEASAAGIIEERSILGASIVYRFCHAFWRQTLYDEIVAPRRIRLHQQVARTLENIYAHRRDEHAAELAEHFSFYSDSLNLAKSVHFGELAAQRASDVFAYGEAARQLDRVLVVQDLVDPDDRAKRCDLLLMLGNNLLPAGETERVITHVAPDALALAEGLGDRRRAFRACGLAVNCLRAQGGGVASAQPEYLHWAERATRYAEPGSSERSYADVGLAAARYSRGQFAQSRALLLEALELARDQADVEAFCSAAAPLIRNTAPQYWDEQVRLAKECAGRPRPAMSSHTLAAVLLQCGMVCLAEGERAEAEELWRQAEELAERTRVANVYLLVARNTAVLSIVDGRLEDVLVRITRLVERSDELGAPILGRLGAILLLLAPALCLGRPDIWLSAFDAHGWPSRLARPGPPTAFFMDMSGARAVCLAQLGRLAEARAQVSPLLDDIEGSLDEDIPLEVPVLLLQAAVALEHRAAAAVLAARLECVAHLAIGEFFYSCVARHLGDAAALAGDRAVAREYYVQALETAGKIRFRPELALTHLRLAELLVGGGEGSEALEHLDVAIPELRDMNMQPGLERGLHVLELLNPRAPAAPTEPESHALTAREHEVAQLVAAGRSNREIADALVIAESTVEVHLKHILSKLGFRSRAQVATWLADRRSTTAQ